MSYQHLAPENTKRAQTTAISTFNGFSRPKTQRSNSCWSVFVKPLDRFAMYLAFSQGRGGEVRKKNTVMRYYRNVKNWLLKKYPRHHNVIDQRLLKMEGS
ncbi:hypothetical protein PHMEG_00034050 [Phytophthora megakarya]|uniref:Uncharacterized protein n=1 Tax=Phytophthora megakarya TaxID=4795 RepID=A0A225URX6_9STRA|nr:hypothetical protein PHMEG_00034050 [Phytophthora megakarya]